MDDHEFYKIYFQLRRLKADIPEIVHEGYKRHRSTLNDSKKRKDENMRYYEKNREIILQKQQVYRETGDRKKAIQEYRKSENGKRSNKISKWKQAGVQHPDFNELYDIWTAATNCADCDVILVEGNEGGNRKCVDHDHETGLFRDIICHKCNIIRGQKDNLKKIQEAISKLSF
jgi:hypothetical protein